jgi:hypothetical protein
MNVNHCVHGVCLNDPCEACEVFLVQIETWLDWSDTKIDSIEVPTLLEVL